MIYVEFGDNHNIPAAVNAAGMKWAMSANS